MQRGKTVHELSIGQTAQVSKTISESDIYGFAGITGDFNPAHVNEQYASNTFFEKRIAHGGLLVGFISAVLGAQCPGPGAIYVSQELSFKKPVYIGDTITAQIKVVELDPEKNLCRCETSCVNQDGDLVAIGESVLKPTKGDRSDSC